MAFVELIREPDDVPNHGAAFAHRPEIYRAWQQLSGAIKESMDLRRYELATIAAARRLRSSYCLLAHGSVLLENGVEPVERLREEAAGSGGRDDADDLRVREPELAQPVDVLFGHARGVSGDLLGQVQTATSCGERPAEWKSVAIARSSSGSTPFSSRTLPCASRQ